MFIFLQTTETQFSTLGLQITCRSYWGRKEG